MKHLRTIMVSMVYYLCLRQLWIFRNSVEKRRDEEEDENFGHFS